MSKEWNPQPESAGKLMSPGSIGASTAPGPERAPAPPVEPEVGDTFTLVAYPWGGLNRFNDNHIYDNGSIVLEVEIKSIKRVKQVIE